jgi:60kDa lysophospholipase
VGNTALSATAIWSLKNDCSATLRIFPGITAATVRAFLSPPIKGVVLETYGAGNAPQSQDLRELLRQACNQGVVIVAISQCARGSVSDAYETGRTLLQAGVIPGGDMTPEVSGSYNTNHTGPHHRR